MTTQPYILKWRGGAAGDAEPETHVSAIGPYADDYAATEWGRRFIGDSRWGLAHLDLSIPAPARDDCIIVEGIYSPEDAP